MLMKYYANKAHLTNYEMFIIRLNIWCLYPGMSFNLSYINNTITISFLY
jgi:hypothetical protein